jgi:hypothetical protein
MATAKERFESQNSMRDQVLQRGRDCSDITIPALMPPDGSDENTPLPTPYQSLGSRGVNNLASKLRLSLFPPGQPFFRFRPAGDALQMLADTDPDAAAAIESAMQKLENEALDELEQGSDSVILHAALKQLVTVGNVLMHMPNDSNSRLFRLNNFVVLRDASGNWFEIVAREILARATLPPEQEALLDAPTGDPKVDDADVTVYTHIRKEGDKAVWNQEINEEIVPGSDGRSSYKDCPYIPLRWAGLENENYGRGHVEEYLGDLRSLEDLSKSLVQMSAAAAKVIFLDRPNSTTDLQAVQEAESGDFVEGNIEDIGVLQLNKYPDFQVAKSQIDDLSLRLSHAFLLTTGTVRNAERVTAEEIRMQAQELEDVLGGVYSVLAAELQQKVVRRLMARLKKKGRLPQLPTGAIEPVIVTGFEALGRGHELNKLRQYFSDGAALFGEAFMQEFNIGSFADVLATQHNVDVSAIKKSEEEKAQEQQQAQMAALADKTAGPVAGQAAKGLADNMNQQ